MPKTLADGCFLSALALARRQCLQTHHPEADLLAQMVTCPPGVKEAVALMDFNVPVSDLFPNAIDPSPMHGKMDPLAWAMGPFLQNKIPVPCSVGMVQFLPLKEQFAFIHLR